MKHEHTFFIVSLVLLAAGLVSGYEAPSAPFAPSAEQEGSTAVHYTDSSISAWVSSVVEVTFGEEVTDDGNWKDTASVIGPASGGVDSDVLVLGRGGSVVLEFATGIADMDGFDFVVFENAFSETFLELAYVELSSDGQHFVRFPGYSLTAEPVGTWGNVSAALVTGFAGKYGYGKISNNGGYGTPFDIAVLSQAYEGVLNGYSGFSDEFESQLLLNYPYLDPQAIRYVRLVDIMGDGSRMDCEGYPVYDPYPTFLTAGFDLDAVGVIHSAMPALISFADWAQGNQLSGDPEADFDGDKWKDLLEYHFNTDPRDSKSVPEFQLQVDAINERYNLDYLSNASAEGSLNVHYSEDGSVWVKLDTGSGNLVGFPEILRSSGVPLVQESVPIPSLTGEGFFYFSTDSPE